MSRVIKFRVWCPSQPYTDYVGNSLREVTRHTKARYAGSDDYYLNSEGAICYQDYDYVGEVPPSWGYVLEQFTGLLDKNGREIYEGDIIKWSHGPVDIGVVEYRCHDEFGSYPSAAFYGLPVPRFAGLCQFQSDDEYEVLGNIHENPNLLK